jgi:hypothetical protein
MICLKEQIAQEDKQQKRAVSQLSPRRDTVDNLACVAVANASRPDVSVIENTTLMLRQMAWMDVCVFLRSLEIDEKGV